MGGHVGVRSGMACSGHVQTMTDYCLLASILTAKISQHQDERAIRQRCSQSFMCIQKCTPECRAFAGQCEIGGGSGGDCAQAGAQRIRRFSQVQKGASSRFRSVCELQSSPSIPQRKVASDRLCA